MLEQFRDSGKKVVGCTCSYIPEELIMSADLQPFRVTNVRGDLSPLAPRFICPFASATLDNMLKDEKLYSGFVVAHTCDPMWRLYDMLKKKTSKPLFLLRVPHNTDNELSFDFFKKELERLKIFLEKNYGAKIEDDALMKCIRLCNESRNILKNIYLSNSDGNCGASGIDRVSITLASMWMPKKDFVARAREISVKSEKKDCGTRVHINGTAVYDLELIREVERAGGFIASDDLCTGSRYFWSNVEKLEDPLSALADRYLHRTPCPSQSPLMERLSYLEMMIEKFSSRGVITFAERFCDPILYDIVHLRNMLDQKDIPSILVEYENPKQEISRIKSRLEAFIESIGD